MLFRRRLNVTMTLFQHYRNSIKCRLGREIDQNVPGTVAGLTAGCNTWNDPIESHMPYRQGGNPWESSSIKNKINREPKLKNNNFFNFFFKSSSE